MALTSSVVMPGRSADNEEPDRLAAASASARVWLFGWPERWLNGGVGTQPIESNWQGKFW